MNPGFGYVHRPWAIDLSILYIMLLYYEMCRNPLSPVNEAWGNLQVESAHSLRWKLTVFLASMLGHIGPALVSTIEMSLFTSLLTVGGCGWSCLDFNHWGKVYQTSGTPLHWTHSLAVGTHIPCPQGCNFLTPQPCRIC